MNLISLVAIYFVVWWVVLFAILPWGTRTQEEEGEAILGSMPGAPAKPMLVKKAIGTSIVAAVIVGLLWLAVDVYGLNLQAISNWLDFRQ